jgi:NitT/TauT family transport system ATP-binding protein
MQAGRCWKTPAILRPESFDHWLGVEPDPHNLLITYPSEPVTMWPIFTRVNAPENKIASSAILRHQTHGDRILIFSSSPGRIVSEIKVNLPQPRHRLDPRFRELVEQIYVAMTTRPSGQPRESVRSENFPGLGIGSVLPLVSPNRLAGLIETVAAEPDDGKADLPIIASILQKEVDDLFPIAETLQMLRFADVGDGDIRLTEARKDFAAAEMDERKQLFRRQLLCYVPLAQHIRRVLDERASHTAPKSRFLDELEDYMTAEAAEQTLSAVIDWGRYAPAFAYDDEKTT